MKIKNSINLLPSEIRTKYIKKYKKREKKVNKIIYLPLIIALIIFFVLNFFISSQIKNYTKKINKYNNGIKSIEKKRFELNDKINKVKILKEKIKKKSEYLKDVKQLLGKKKDSFSVSNMIKEITLVMPNDVWLYEMEYDDSEYKVLLKGEAFNNELLKKLLLGLQKTSILSEVTLNSSKGIKNEDVLLTDFQIEGLIYNEENITVNDKEESEESEKEVVPADEIL